MNTDHKDRWGQGKETTAHSSEPVQPVLPHTTHDVFIPPHIDHDPLAEVPVQTEDAQAAGPIAQVGETERPKRRRKKKNSRRQRQMRRRQRRITAIAVVLGVFCLWLILRWAPIPFGLLTVSGNETLTTEDVYHSSGVYSYVNVVQLSPDEIQHRLEQDLRIASVSVTRQFPATIQVRLVERKAAAVITTMYGFAYVDKDGTVMDIQPQIKGISVPIFTGKRVDTLLLGEKIADPAIMGSLAYLQHLSPDIAPQIAEINVGNPDNVIAYTSDSLPIHLGTCDDPAARADITAELLGQVQDHQSDVQYIDTNVRAPFVKEK